MASNMWKLCRLPGFKQLVGSNSRLRCAFFAAVCASTFPCRPSTQAFRRSGCASWGELRTRHVSGGQPETISRFPVPYKKELPYDIVELMEEVESKGGFLPNVFKVLAHRPAEFRVFFAYYNELMNKETGRLTKADRELIVVATSAHNNCLYCVVSHSALHRIYSRNPTLCDQVVINYETAELSSRERAMLNFANAVRRCDTITEQHFLALEEVGFDREDAWDIAAITAFFAMSNRLAHVTDMRPNLEFYNMGRIPRDKGKDKVEGEDK